MHSTEADLSPAERRREIAAIFAVGILRLSTRPETTPEPAGSGAESAPANRPDSAQKSLDPGCGTSPHGPSTVNASGDSGSKGG
jgi:hypothetical protein